jgi:hypothetical protein
LPTWVADFNPLHVGASVGHPPGSQREPTSGSVPRRTPCSTVSSFVMSREAAGARAHD